MRSAEDTHEPTARARGRVTFRCVFFTAAAYRPMPSIYTVMPYASSAAPLLVGRLAVIRGDVYVTFLACVGKKKKKTSHIDKKYKKIQPFSVSYIQRVSAAPSLTRSLSHSLTLCLSQRFPDCENYRLENVLFYHSAQTASRRVIFRLLQMKIHISSDR